VNGRWKGDFGMRDWVTPEQAERHEALVTRLLRLLRQVESVAARRPDEPVSAALETIAADLLFEATQFCARKLRALPVPAPDYPGLAAQLGQALADLETFEARHTVWDAAQKAFVWRFTLSRARPIARLRQAVAPPVSPKDSRALHERLQKLLDARAAEQFDKGFAAGRAARAGEE